MYRKYDTSLCRSHVGYRQTVRGSEGREGEGLTLSLEHALPTHTFSPAFYYPRLAALNSLNPPPSHSHIICHMKEKPLWAALAFLSDKRVHTPDWKKKQLQSSFKCLNMLLLLTALDKVMTVTRRFNDRVVIRLNIRIWQIQLSVLWY